MEFPKFLDEVDSENWRFHLQILPWNDSEVQRLPVEINHPNSIYEDGSGTFSMA
jgi:hypothetical protein